MRRLVRPQVLSAWPSSGSPSNPVTVKKKLLLFLASCAAALAVGEPVARWLYGDGFNSALDPYEHHPYKAGIHYTDERGVTVATNELGWKASENASELLPVSPAENRIVMLGDSFTEGLGLPQSETIAAALQTSLNRRGRSFEVLNGGRVSYSPILEYQRLKRFLAAGYRADTVVLLVDISDVQDELGYRQQFVYDSTDEPLRLRGGDHSAPARWIYNNLALARVARRGFNTVTGRAPPEADHRVHGEDDRRQAAREIDNFGEVLTAKELASSSRASALILRANWTAHPPSLRGWASDGLALVERGIIRIQRLCEAQGIELLVVTYPWPQMLYTGEQQAGRYRELSAYFDHWYADRQALLGVAPSAVPSFHEERIRDACHRHGIAFLGLEMVVHDSSGWERLYLEGDVHFNKAGSHLIAEAIGNRLEGHGQGQLSASR
jgi:hypothetical protein